MVGQRPVIGVLDPSIPLPEDAETAALGALRTATALVELRRRLAGSDLRAYTLAPVATPSELAEDLAESLAPWGPGSAVALKREIDALVVLPRPAAGRPVGGSEEVEAAVGELAALGLPVHRMTTDSEHPDPLVLAGRLASATLLDRRREYLALTGQIPAGAPYVLCLPPSSAADALDERVGPRRAVVRPAGRLAPIDLMALVALAETVVTCSPQVRALARGLGRPAVPGVADLDSTGSPACDPVKDAERLEALVSLADRAFDGLYQRLVEQVGGRPDTTPAERVEWLERRVAVLEAANAGLRRTLERERTVMAAELRRRQAGPDASSAAWSAFNVERMTRDLAAAHVSLARLQGEIDAVYATRTMRALAPLRRLYRLARRIVAPPS